MHLHRALSVLFALALSAPAVAGPRPLVDLQLVAISDWHAQLDPLNGVGGAAALSSYFKQERTNNPNTLTITAGDAFGGSPPLSAMFDEEPAVRAMNLMGIDVDTLGNHNFDRGLAHLQGMIDLAEFPYVSANLEHLEGNLEGVDKFVIFDVGGVKVAIIGITNDDAHHLVFPGSFGDIHIADPISSANQARAQAQALGAKVCIAITHLGITGFDAATGAPVGPLVDFANNVGNFDVIFGDHTDVQFSGVINGALVVENRSKGQTYSRTTLSVDPENGRIGNVRNEFVRPLASAVTPDAAVVEMLAPYRASLSQSFDRRIGVATGVFQRGSNIERLREVAIGNLVADSLRARYGTQIALTNGGGIRASIPSSYLPADRTLRRTTSGYAAGPPFDVVVGDAFSVLPFGNVVVTRTVTGAQLYGALEHSVARLPNADGRFAQISGFRFVYTLSQPAGSRIVSVTLDDGTPISRDDTTYTFATNDFTNAGGDGYTMFADRQGTTREVMADVLLAYIEALGTITPSTDGRISAQ